MVAHVYLLIENHRWEKYRFWVCTPLYIAVAETAEAEPAGKGGGAGENQCWAKRRRLLKAGSRPASQEGGRVMLCPMETRATP